MKDLIDIHHPSEDILKNLFEQHFNEKCIAIEQLAISGSNRIYFRLFSDNQSVIGTYSPDSKETQAFISFTKHFEEKGLAVPKLLASDIENNCYLQEDLGDIALYTLLPKEGENFPISLVFLYKNILEELAKMQILGRIGLDWSVCYPRPAFDRQSMLWDLHYFKNYFLKLAKISFDEQLLEDDFNNFIQFLLEAEDNFFLFRDFQSRNIIIKDDKPYFIDYQGGRKGALQYDVASLLFQAKGNIPHSIREELLIHYLDYAEKLMPIDRKQFMRYYYGFVLIRCLQALGTYGFRGLYERKEHFIVSIPFAIKNIAWLLENVQIPVEIPELRNCLKAMINSKQYAPFDKSKSEKSPLTITISSFSYKKGLPEDTSEHGGGFVFDCRAIENPGRYQTYKHQTGQDEQVINFLRNKTNVEEYLMYVYHLVDQSVENYLDRNFESLSVHFGCTGGQHRSVYCAESLNRHLKNKYGVKTKLSHREQSNWSPKINLAFKGK